MSVSSGWDIVQRWDGNPIITLRDLGFRVSDVHNAGVARVGNQVLMLVTIESLQGYTLVYKALSTDGRNFSVDPKPLMEPQLSGPRALYENHGVRDARITPVDDTYFISYLADGDHGVRVGLAETKDFQTIEHRGYISQPDVKNGILFPKKFNGRYALLKRPAGGDIWISYSEDLEYWGDEKVVMSKRGGYWDSNRIGPSCVPIEVDRGWLLVYYGIKDTSAGPLCRLGAAILDRDDPSKVLARSNIPILSPRERYERIGDVPNFIFSCGALVEDNLLQIYYGASDSCICVGSADLDEICEFCLACAVVHDFLREQNEQEDN